MKTISAIIFATILILNIQYSYQQFEACCQPSRYLPNIDYCGNDLPGSPYQVTTADQCCALCQQTSTCQAWTFVCNQFNPACSQCYLKSCVGNNIRCNSSSK